MGAIELTALLWREREELQAVIERQQELAETLRSADPGRIERALAAREDALDRLRPVVLTRDIEIVALADEWGVLTGLTLATIPRFAPPGPWGGIFADHLRVLRDLAARAVDDLRTINDLLSTQGTPQSLRLPVAPEDYGD